MVNQPFQVTDLQVLEHFGNSDHNMITFSLQCPIDRNTRAPRKVVLYSQGNYEDFDSKFELIYWASLLNGRSLQQCGNKFKNVFIPHKFVKAGSRNVPPWTRYKSIRKAKQRRRHKWVDYRKSKLDTGKILYHQESANISHAISSTKSHYENKLVRTIKEDPKRVWNYMYTGHFIRLSSTVDMFREKSIRRYRKIHYIKQILYICVDRRT